MKKLSLALTTLALGAGLFASPLMATASTTRSTTPGAVCDLIAGSVSGGGDHYQQRFVATTPAQGSDIIVTRGVYPAGQARLSSHFETEPTATGGIRSGKVVLGDALYHHSYSITKTGAIDRSKPGSLTRVGGGWSKFKYFESSAYWYNRTTVRSDQYGLRADGVLFRWSVGEAGYWKSTGSAGGFAAIKSMALISKTATYDTFLANARGGALYTIRIPLKGAMKPVVKKVRSATWQNFDSLLASGCGNGTTIVAIDRDTQKAYLYTMSHANGVATVIKGHGQLPGSFRDTVNFRWSSPSKTDVLVGE